MKRKLPVLIAIVLVLIIALTACQPQEPIPNPGNQTDPLPSHVRQPASTGQTALPANKDTQPVISKDEAIAIALKDAGFTEKDVTGLRAELDRDDDIPLYEVDFYKDGTEYDYEINAATGKIIKAERDRND